MNINHEWIERDILTIRLHGTNRDELLDNVQELTELHWDEIANRLYRLTESRFDGAVTVTVYDKAAGMNRSRYLWDLWDANDSLGPDPERCKYAHRDATVIWTLTTEGRGHGYGLFDVFEWDEARADALALVDA